MKAATPDNSILHLIYDGNCVLCRNCAQAIKLKKSIGKIELINAREFNPIVKEIIDKGYDLNEGIVIKYKEQYFYGVDAVNFLALVGSRSDLFNCVNAFLFKYKWTSQLFYPIFKTIRNVILFIRKIPSIPIAAQKPLIQKIYGSQMQDVPLVLQKRYSNRPNSQDILQLKGEMNIITSKTFRLLSPLFRLAGALVPYPAKKISATVKFESNTKSNRILMSRTFYYPDRSPYYFNSRVIHIRDNIVIELLRLGLAAKLIYRLEKNKIVMEHGGYVFCFGKILIPIPLRFLIGKIYSHEEAISDDQFNMLVKLSHSLFGEIFQYDGCFKIVNSNE